MWRRMRMTNFTVIIIMIVIILLLLSPAVLSMQIELVSGTRKCITEDINHNALTVGKYSVVKPNQSNPIPDASKISVRVTSPHGKNYHYSNRVEASTFAFTSEEAGDYTLCFWAPAQNPAKTLSIDLEWRSGFAAREWPSIAKKSHLREIEIELKKLLDKALSIYEGTSYLRQRDEEMEELNASTNANIVAFIFLSILVCSSVAALQLWHLKAFFESKKFR